MKQFDGCEYYGQCSAAQIQISFIYNLHNCMWGVGLIIIIFFFFVLGKSMALMRHGDDEDERCQNWHHEIDLDSGFCEYFRMKYDGGFWNVQKRCMTRSLLFRCFLFYFFLFDVFLFDVFLFDASVQNMAKRLNKRFDLNTFNPFNPFNPFNTFKAAYKRKRHFYHAMFFYKAQSLQS